MYSNSKLNKRVFSFILALCLVLNLLLTSGIIPAAVWAADEASAPTGTTQVLYVDGKGSGNKDGSSEANALQYVSEAYAKIPDDNVKTTIVICGAVNFGSDAGIQTVPSVSYKYFRRNAENYTHTGEVVFTAKYGDVDHLTDNSGAISFPTHFALMGNTTFENINIKARAYAFLANYFTLHIGEGVDISDNWDKLFADMLYLGASQAVFNMLDATTSEKLQIKDIEFAMESGVVNKLYGGGSGDQGWSNRQTAYNLKMNLMGGTVNNLYVASNGRGGSTGETAVSDATLVISGGTVGTLNKKIDNGTVTGKVTLAYENVTVSEPHTTGFDVLKLTNANVTVSSLTAGISVAMDDASRLTFTAAPAAPVNVTVTKTGDVWNTESALITAPAGTAKEMFVLSGGASWAYDASGENATWTLSNVAQEEPTVPETEPETEPIEGFALYVDGVGSGTKDGSSKENALAYVSEAYAKIPDDNVKTTIVICGAVNMAKDPGLIKFADSYGTEYTYYRRGENALMHSGEVVFTSDGSGSLAFPTRFALTGDTTFRNIKITNRAYLMMANYFTLHIGKGVDISGNGDKLFAANLYLGTYASVFSHFDETSEKITVKDVAFTMESGAVDKLYGGGYSDQGWSNREIAYNLEMNFMGGTVNNLYIASNGYNSDGHTPVANVTVTFGGGAVGTLAEKTGNGTINGTKTIEYKNATVTNPLTTGFDILKLTSSKLTLPAGMENLWSTIKKLEMSDDSVITLTTIPATPENAVEVILTKSGEEWNTSSALIKAPAGTVNMFEVVSPLDYGFVYADNGSAATWTVKHVGVNIGTAGTAGEKLDIDLGLPEDGSFTPLPENATAYETFLQKWEDLGNAKYEVNVVSPVAVKGAYELYVDSTTGNDENTGSIDKPFKTIDKALTYVEALQKMDVKGIIVFLRQGTYFAHETIKLNERHCNANGVPMIISAYNNEKVVITSSVSIPGSAFKPITDTAIMDRLRDSAKSAVVQVDLKAMGITELGKIVGGNQGGPNYQIYVNGNEYIPARYPNATNLWVGEVLDQGPIISGSTPTNTESTGVEFKMQDFRPTMWQNDGNIWLKGSMYAEWDIKNIRVAEIRRESIKLDGGAEYGARSLETNTYYYYNILEELDAPGEYYVDLNTGILYLYSVPNMDEATITYSGNTDALFMLSNTKNVVLNGLTIQNGAGTGVYMNKCEQTIVQNSTISRVSTGLYMNNCKKSGIIYSEISEIANRPVEIYPAQVDFDYTPAHNFIQNCYIHSTGTKNPKFCGIYVRGTGHIISHNLIQGGFSVSIYLQYTKGCIVEYNEIVGSPTGTNDGAAIYLPAETLGTGNHIRYNYIHDIGRFSDETDPWGIYFDEGLSGNFAYGNVMVNVPGGFHNNGGSENVIVNNVVMNVEKRAASKYSLHGGDNLSVYTLDQKERGNALKRYNAYLALSDEQKAEFKARDPLTVALFNKMGEALASPTGEKTIGVYVAHDNYIANNIIYNHGSIVFDGEDHQYKNNHIFRTNPFVDVANHNFSLKPSVTTSFDYTPLDMDRVGVLTDNKQGIGEFEGIMPVAGEQKANSLELLLRWTIAAGADTYELKIATNAEMTENLRTIVLESTQLWFVTDPYFDYDTTYYWTVTAYSTAESRDVEPVKTEVMSFKTMTKEDYLANNRADTAFLEEAIKKAETLTQEIVAAGDLYDSATLAELQAAIEVAKAAKDNREFTQVDVNLAKLDLEDAMQMAKIKRKVNKVTFDDLNPEEWADRMAGTTKVEMKDGALYMTVDDHVRSEALYTNALHVRDILCFKYKIDTKKNWNGFALAQTNPGAFITSGTDGYFICINPTQIELQKYYGGQKVVQIDVKVPLDLFKGGEYYDIEVGAINYPDGTVGIHFKINDQLIFDPTVHIDTAEDKAIPGTPNQKLPGAPIIGCGNFGVVVNPENGSTHILKADEENLGIVEIDPPVGPSDPSDPSEPTVPSDPSDPSDPADPADPTDPADPSTPSDGTENGGFFATILEAIVGFFASIVAFFKRLFGF